LVVEVAQVVWQMRAIVPKSWVQPCGVMIVNSLQTPIAAAAEHSF
jgi:hypothetical protein